MMRHVPYPDLTDEAVETNFEEEKFPEVESLEDLGDIIADCWSGKYNSMDGVIRDIDTRYSPPKLLSIPSTHF